MELSATAKVLIGFLAVAPRSGYDVKSIVDRSTRFFWAASYGQIYPELKRLAAAGLVEADQAPKGGRRRTVYRLTPAGREAFREWMAVPAQVFELRDEGLLKVFFSSLDGDEPSRRVLEEKREMHSETLARLEEIEDFARSANRFGPLETLEYGIQLHRYSIEWCDRCLAQLKEDEDA